MDHYLVSARKYRPSTFASVVGQKALTSTLKNAIATGRLAHSYLFCGSRGVGKTSCARIFSKTINCLNPTPDGEACNECVSCQAFNDGASMNIIELDAASNNSVDDIRELTNQVLVPPSVGKYRVFIVDEVHMLSSQAFNAFLKTLEEPPSYVIFILATTEKQKILPTILSRCQIYDFKRITVPDIVDHLAYVAAQEGITAEPAALGVIARKADGAMRDALSIFDQVAASSRGNITFQSTVDSLNVLDFHYYNALIECFLSGNVLQSWLIYKEIRDRGFDSHFFLNGLADYLRDLMVARHPSTLPLLETDDQARAEISAVAAKLHPEFLLRAMALCNDADLRWRDVANKQFLVELTLAKICQLCSPSPANNAGAESEGQLKPIGAKPQAAPPTSSAAAPSTPSASAPTPAPAPATAPSGQPPSQRPAVAPRGAAPSRGRTTLRTGSFSINQSAPSNSQPASPSAPATSADKAASRNADFTDEQLAGAWGKFREAHTSRHILVNTMRVSLPQLIEGRRYAVVVQNEKQREELVEAMPELLKFLRDSLANDLLTIDVSINQGEATPDTWSERQVLSHMSAHSPELANLIDSLGLTLG